MAYRDDYRDRHVGSMQSGGGQAQPDQPNMPSRSQRMLERILPSREAPKPPAEVNPFQKALDDYDRVSRELMVTKDDLHHAQQSLVGAYQEIDALKGRLDHEGDFYRSEIEKVKAERDIFARKAVQLAAHNQSIGEAARHLMSACGEAGQHLLNLTIQSDEIVRMHGAYYGAGDEAEVDRVDGMERSIGETIGSLYQPSMSPLPPNKM